MSKARKYYPSDFYCVMCGNKTIPIVRKIGQFKEKGHLKKLYCPYCKEQRNCVEIKSFQNAYTLNDFQIEFENHNFDSEGNRIIPYKQLIVQLIKQEGELSDGRHGV